jgi:hypothetical protein
MQPSSLLVRLLHLNNRAACFWTEFFISHFQSPRKSLSPDDERNRRHVTERTATEAPGDGDTCIAKLAQLFPSASPVRISVRVTALGARRKRMHEQTTIEFGTAQEVLFFSTLPLEFEDRLRLANADGSLDAHATVIAVRYHGGRKAIAARFAEEVGNWIIKP